MKVLHEVDLGELNEIRKLQDRQRQLHLPIMPVTFIDLVVRGEDGVIKQKYSDRSKSWVRNMYNFIAMQHFGAGIGSMGNVYGEGTLVMRSTAGGISSSTLVAVSPREVSVGSGSRHFRSAGWGDTEHGIILGSGNKEEDFNDFNLETLITHGTSSGQMFYGDMPELSPFWDSENRKAVCLITRSCTNSSGSAVSVNEIGLRCSLYASSTSFTITTSYTVSRDKLSGTILVDDGDILDCVYTIESFYP